MGLSLDDEGHRWENRHEINNVFRSWFAERKITDFENNFNELGLTWSRFRTTKEALTEDADTFSDNPMFQKLSFEGIGEYMVPRSPLEFSNYDNLPAQKPPKL